MAGHTGACIGSVNHVMGSGRLPSWVAHCARGHFVRHFKQACALGSKIGLSRHCKKVWHDEGSKRRETASSRDDEQAGMGLQRVRPGSPAWPGLRRRPGLDLWVDAQRTRVCLVATSVVADVGQGGAPHAPGVPAIIDPIACTHGAQNNA